MKDERLKQLQKMARLKKPFPWEVLPELLQEIERLHDVIFSVGEGAMTCLNCDNVYHEEYTAALGCLLHPNECRWAPIGTAYNKETEEEK